MLLNCFVAMPIGKPETERLYRQSLKPALTQPRVMRPIRVDETNRNDPIDAQIYDLMNRCHFCVADLTFSRPSVYYEAGWVRGRGKPVIFTCRADHLSRRIQPDDPHGVKRVHFDLDHENIIGWKTPDDSRFRRKLASRIRVVSRPLLRSLQQDLQAQQEVDAFNRLSLSRRLDALHDVAAALLRRHSHHNLKYTRHGLSAVNTSHRPPRAVLVAVRRTMSKTFLDELDPRTVWLRHHINQPRTPYRRVDFYLVSCSSVRPATVEAAFPRWHPDPQGNTWRRNLTAEEWPHDLNEHVIHLIANVASEPDFRTRMRGILLRENAS